MNGTDSLVLHLLWMVPLVVAIGYIGSPRFRGTMGEDRVRRLLSAGLPSSQYTVFYSVVIPSGGGTRRIPHLVVSQFGVFVICALHRSGRITGTRVQDLWSQTSWGRKKRFNNPVYQNELSVQALERLLGQSGIWSHSMIALTSDCSFTGERPAEVIPVGKLVPAIRHQGRKMLEPAACHEILRTIKENRIESKSSRLSSRWRILRWLLLVVFVASCWWVFGKELGPVIKSFSDQIVHSSGSARKPSEQSETSSTSVPEPALICAYSSDTDRCVCYDKSGESVRVEKNQCRNLAEEGSLLNH